jgi:2-amino-4-hydroxy-6-hydroxymethyldihydropteridine diphosphokinase
LKLETYAIALGSNRPHGRHGNPRRVLSAAVAALEAEGLAVRAVSRTIETAPLGPSLRLYANAAAIIETDLAPPALLALLKRIERDFGRRRGQRWSSRVLDLDIILWSGGCFAGPGLVIPHLAYRTRGFVLRPMVTIAPDWRDPLTGLTPLHLTHPKRLTQAQPPPRARPRSGP